MELDDMYYHLFGWTKNALGARRTFERRCRQSNPLKPACIHDWLMRRHGTLDPLGFFNVVNDWKYFPHLARHRLQYRKGQMRGNAAMRIVAESAVQS